MSTQTYSNGSSRTNGNDHYRTTTTTSTTTEPPRATPPRTDTATATGTPSATVGHLLKDLLHEGTSMLRNEVALARAEATETLRTTKEGAAAVGSGGAVAMAGFIILLLGAVYGLGTVMAPWLAALIVGGVVVFAGLAMVQAGKKKFRSESLRPERTLDSLHKDRDAIRRRNP